MADYRVDIDVNVNDSKLDALENRINNLKNKDIDININVNNGDINKVFAAAMKNMQSVGKNLKITPTVNTGAFKQINSMLTTLNKNNTFTVKTVGIDSLGKLRTEIRTIDKEGKELNFKISVKDEEVTQAKTEAQQLREELKKAESIKMKINVGDVSNQFSKIESDFKTLSNVSKDTQKAMDDFRVAKKLLDEASSGNNNKELVKSAELYEEALKRVKNQIDINTRAEKEAASVLKLRQDTKNFSLSMSSWLKNNSAAEEEFGSRVRSLQNELKSCDAIRFDGIKSEFKSLTTEAELAGKTGLNFTDRLKMQFTRLAGYFGASSVIMGGIQATRQMFENVKDVDAQLTELYRVTDLSSSQYSMLYDNLTVSAQKYGAALTDLISATADWSRAGFDANTAAGLAEVTSVYQHISDLDYDEAAQNLLTSYKGFESELKEAFNGDAVEAVSYVSDILNELDNNYAVTAAGVGEAMKRSASAMSVAGNTIQETAGMVTGIAEVTQDPEKAGNALKVVSMRLRGMKGELEELGEETDENVENLSKMQGQILNLTHGKVNIFKDNGDFKSTYEILQGIAKVWDDITDTDRAELLETVAGKHRANDVAAIFQNWEHVEAATKSAADATGSAMKEQEKYADSIQGRLNSLQAMWQQFSNTFMSSDLIKGAITALTSVLDVIEKIIDKIGGIGTAGIIGALTFGFKHRNNSNLKNLFSDFSILGQMLSESFKSLSLKGLNGSVKSAKGLFGDLKASAQLAGESIHNSFKSLEPEQKFKAIAAGISVIGTAVAIGVELWNGYIQKIEQTRQKAIDTSNTFSDSFGTFEQAYIKYSDKTTLTSDEESELTSAIDGTISALGDKSSALRDAAGASSEYAQNLDAIAEAELKQGQSLANKGKSAAMERMSSWITGGDNPGELTWGEFLKGMIPGLGWKWSNADFKLPTTGIFGDKKTYNAIKDIIDNTDFKKYVTPDNVFRYDAKANNIDGYIKQLNMAQSVVDRLNKTASDTGDDSYLNSETYKTASESIESMSSGLNDYIKQTYAAEKATYQLKNGIPKTVDEFYDMQNAILSASSSTVEGRKEIANLIYDEYKNTFDLSSAKSQIKQLQGVTKDIDSINGDKEKKFETLIDVKTMVNSGECSVGDYTKALDDANNAINEIAKTDLGTANALRIQLGIEVDENGNAVDKIKQVRDKLVRALTDNSIDADVAAKFADSLDAQEIEATVDLIASGEIDMSDVNTNNLDDKLRKKIEDYSKYLKAMKFDINIDTETEGFEKLNSALAESKTATGLTAESIGKLEKRYENLSGYNVAKLFEETANGIRLNTTEQQKLEKEYSQSRLKEANSNLSIMKDRYDELDRAIKNCTDASQMANYVTEQNNVRERINALAQEAAMYDGLASKYKAWQDAESAGSDRDMYEGVLGGFKEIEDEISRGWLDDASKAFIDMFSSSQLNSIDDYINRWNTLGDTIEGTSYSVKDFFTQDSDGNSTNDGIYNFLDAVDQLGLGNIERKDGEIVSFDFGVDGEKAIADAMGISEELVQIILRASEDAGFTINMDGAYTSLADLQNAAQEANDKLVRLKANNEGFLSDFNQSDISFNFSEKTLEGVGTQLDKAKKLLDSDQFKVDGEFNIETEGAQEALTIAQTLQAQWDQLNKPAYMSVDTSQVDKAIKEPIEKMQEFDNLSTQKHQMVLAGVDTSEVDKQMDDLVDYLYNLEPEVKTQLGIDQSSKEELKNDLENDKVSIPAELNLQAQMDSKLGVLVDQALHDAGLIDDEEYEKRLKIYVDADVDTEDAEEDAEKSGEKILKSLGVSQEAIDEMEDQLNSSGIIDKLDSAKQKLSEWANSAKETVSSWKDSAKETVSGWKDSINQAASDTWNAFKDTSFGKMTIQIGEAFSRNFEKVVAPLEEFRNIVDGHIDSIGQSISEKWSNLTGDAGNFIDGAKNKISDWWNSATEGLGNWTESVSKSVSDWVNSTKESISNGLGDIGDFFSEKWNGFTDAISPITNALSILGAGIGKFIEIVGKFAGDKFSDVFSGISDFFKPVTDFFDNAGSFVESGDIFSNFGDWASNAIDSVGDWLSNFYSSINDFIKDPGGNISKTVSDFCQSVIDDIRSGLPKGVNDLIDNAALFFDNNPGVIGDTISNFFDGIKESVGKSVDDTSDSIKSKINEFRSGLPDWFNNLIDGTIAFSKDPIGSFTGLFEKISSSTDKVFNDIKDKFNSKVKEIRGYLPDWLNNLFDFAGGFALDPFGTIFDAIEEPLNTLGGKVQSAIDNTIQKIKDSIPKPIKDLINSFKEAWNLLSDDDAVQNLIDSIGNIDAQSIADGMSAAFDAIGNAITSAIDTCKETVKSKIDEFRSGLPDWLNGLIDGIGGFLDNPIDTLSNLSSNIESFIDGIFDDIKNTISDKIEEIRSGLPDWLNNLIDGTIDFFGGGNSDKSGSGESNYIKKNKWSDSDKIKSSMSDSFEKAGVTSEQEIDTYVNFLVNTDDVDSYTPEQKDAIVMFLKDVGDIDSYTPAQKQAIVDFIKNAKDIDSYTPEQKEAIVKYAVNGGDVDSYSVEDRQAIVDFLVNSADPDSYTPEQKEAIAKFLKDSGEVDGYQPGQKEAIARFLKESSEPDSYQPSDKPATVTYGKDSSQVDGYNPPDIFRSVTYTIKTVGEAIGNFFGFGEADGTAHANGTAFINGTTGKAFKQGNWGTKEDGVALGGELGTELLVRNGRWYTIGENGAEFFGYKKDDIIFNADQTRELFEKGKITHGNGRGRALASGTAFSRGSGGLGRSNKGSSVSSSSSSSGSSSGSSSSSSNSSSGSDSSASEEADKFEETLDWIETAIDRIERAISRLDKTASSTYKKWSKRNSALNDQISKTREEIDLQQRAYDRYMAQAGQVGLSEDYASKVRNGTIDIEVITDEDLNDKISQYKEWYLIMPTYLAINM